MVFNIPHNTCIFLLNLPNPVTWIWSRIRTSMHDVRPSGSSGESLSPPSGPCLGLRRGSETLGKYFILHVKFPSLLTQSESCHMHGVQPCKKFPNSNIRPNERENPTAILKWSYSISVEVISVGHTNFVVEVELTWVQDLGSFPKSSRRPPTNTCTLFYM
jgi:hypothetical protein